MKKINKKALCMYISYTVGFCGLGAGSFILAKPLLVPKVESQQVATTSNIQKTVEVAPKAEAKTETPVAPKAEVPVEKVATSALTPSKNVAPKTAVSAPVSEPAPIKEPSVYDIISVDKSKLIINSPKFNVILDKTSGKAGDTVKFKIVGILGNKAVVSRAEIYATQSSTGSNGQWGTDGTYTDRFVIQTRKMIDNKFKSYIFIKPSGEDITYEYDFDLTVAP